MEAINQFDQIARFTYGSIDLLMYWDGATVNQKCKISYEMRRHGIPIASGNDFVIGQQMYPDSIESIVSLLGFMTVQKGDTDEQYFEKHVPAHLDWLDSRECQELGVYISDYENSDEPELKQAAVQFFTDNSKV